MTARVSPRGDPVRTASTIAFATWKAKYASS
jgi:hypothetical protein